MHEEKPDLLVLGPHRRRIFRDIFIGTTVERTIREADCPVLMANAAPVGPYRHVLLSTDLSEGSRDAMATYLFLNLSKEFAALCASRLRRANATASDVASDLGGGLIAEGHMKKVDPVVAARLLNGAALNAALWVAASDDPVETLPKVIEAFNTMAAGLLFNPLV